jgi:hypothetical protein
MRLPLFRLFLPNAKILRVTAYFVTVFVALSALAARSLYAQVKDAATALGRELLELPELTRGAEVVVLNGARMHHARTITTDSVAAVLDRLEAHCDAKPGAVAEAMNELRAAHPQMFRNTKSVAVMRKDDEEQGMIICFAGERRLGLAGLSEALSRFSKSADLSEFGQLRYAYAERLEAGKTRAVVMWSDGELNVSKMFPATGDAAGADSRVLPRPPASRRTLSAAVEGMPYSLRSYDSSQPAAAIQGFYDAWMKKTGFELGARAEKHGTSVYARPDGYQAFVTIFADQARTSVTLIESSQLDATALATVGDPE